MNFDACLRAVVLVGFATMTVISTQGCAASADEEDEEEVGETSEAALRQPSCRFVRSYSRETYCNPVDPNSDSCIWPAGDLCYGGKAKVTTSDFICNGKPKKYVVAGRCING